jgi:hypothetical protein
MSLEGFMEAHSMFHEAETVDQKCPVCNTVQGSSTFRLGELLECDECGATLRIGFLRVKKEEKTADKISVRASEVEIKGKMTTEDRIKFHRAVTLALLNTRMELPRCETDNMLMYRSSEIVKEEENWEREQLSRDLGSFGEEA